MRKVVGVVFGGPEEEEPAPKVTKREAEKDELPELLPWYEHLYRFWSHYLKHHKHEKKSKNDPI